MIEHENIQSLKGTSKMRLMLELLLLLLVVTNSIDGFSTFLKPSEPRIVVIGAGASGIAAAVKLLEFGFRDVTVLEAMPRIGGRIHTIPFGENVIDLGAQWCHGEEGNVVYELAYKHGLLEHSNENITNVMNVRSNGEVLPEQLAKRLQNITEYIIEKRREDLPNYNGTMGVYMRNKFFEILKLPENSDIDKKIAVEYYNIFELSESGDEASDSLDVIASGDYNLFETVGGDYEMIWKDKGYKEFLRLLMKSHETGKEFGILEDRLRLSKKVKHIKWQHNNSSVLLECEDGEQIEADHVIMTASLGVLKAALDDSMFEPPLPVEKQNVIKALEFGAFNKVFLEFEEKFWTEKMSFISFLWREEDLEDLLKTENAWVSTLYGFNIIPYQPNILEGWIIGPNARFMETMPLENIQAGSVFLLEKFLGIKIPEPKNVKISQWFTNPNVRGCYSYHSVETKKSRLGNEHLAQPIMINCDLQSTEKLCEKPILQFAGEATNPVHYATVHGAVESGFREAKILNDFYKNNNEI